MDLKEKVVLVSGATGGMGEELVKLLAQEGCKLALFARREEKLKHLKDTLGSKENQIIYQPCDVQFKEQVKSAVDLTASTFGTIDLAILTSGILVPNPIQTFDSSIIKQSMDVNFMGTVYFLEQILPVMKKQHGGSIAAVSTLPDHRGVPGWGAYGASKAAISWLMESLRAEAKQRYNINMITIKPGSVETPMIEDFHRTGAISAESAAKIMLKGIKKEKRVIQFPIGQVMMIRIQDLFPPMAYDLFPIEQSKGEGYPKVEEE
jgi:NADP-dependent 3-hydroxy acid dehydrogenase YdfG